MESVIDFANALNALDTDGVPVREHLDSHKQRIPRGCA